MEHSAKFWNKIAPKYAAKPIADEQAYQKKLEITREYLKPDMEVLEIGCGTGGTAIAHAPYVKHIRSTDIAPNMIDIAKEKAKEADVDNVTFECLNTDDLDVADESLDAVLALSILHLLKDRDAVIAKIFKTLKSGGVFVTSTACIADEMAFFRYVGPVGQFLGFFPFFAVFSSKDLETAFTEAGFTIEHQWKPGKNKGVFMIAKKPA
ncbi:MAG: methyltransferase domain-containing protein [Pseudomonadota bacterium]